MNGETEAIVGVRRRFTWRLHVARSEVELVDHAGVTVDGPALAYCGRRLEGRVRLVDLWLIDEDWREYRCCRRCLHALYHSPPEPEPTSWVGSPR